MIQHIPGCLIADDTIVTGFLLVYCINNWYCIGADEITINLLHWTSFVYYNDFLTCQWKVFILIILFIFYKGFF